MKTNTSPVQGRKVDDDIAKANDESLNLPPLSEDSARPEGVPDGMTWGEPPTDSGRQIPRVPLEDEESAAEKLIRGGAEAAQSHVRSSSQNNID